jgi:hypothetical protein
MEPRGRERHRWANREVEMGGSTRVKAGDGSEFQLRNRYYESFELFRIVTKMAVSSSHSY